jgi:hypothetical protein
MRKLLFLICTVIAVTSGTSAWASLYSGVVGWSGGSNVGGATLTGNKWGTVAGLSWTVDQVGSNWDYKYTFSQAGNTKDIKTFDLQVASGFTMADLISATITVTSGVPVNVVAPTSVSNTINEVLVQNNVGVQVGSTTYTLTNGLQWLFNGTEYAFTLDLVSTRAPMWGDFFIHGEPTTNGYDSSARNSDFNTTDALPALAANSNYLGQGVLMPLGAAAPVPIPPSMLLLGSGISGMFFLRRRKITA